jgi:hypothetical protein
VPGQGYYVNDETHHQLVMGVRIPREGPRYFYIMKVTLTFPTYLHLSGFMSVTNSGAIDLDLRTKSLTAIFSEKEIELALRNFNAQTAANFITGQGRNAG